MRSKVGEFATGLAPVTLVVTVLDGGPELTDLLDSVSRQQLLPSELLVVDRGSADGTLGLLQAWQPPHGTVYKVIESPRSSRSEARNLAIESASFEHIALTRSGVRLHTDWLAQLWGAMADGADVVSGVVRPSGPTLLEWTIGAIETRRPQEIDSGRYLPPSTSLAFTKSLWDTVGGYPEWLDAGEDPVFAVALRHAGADFRFVQGAVASWNPGKTLLGYLVESYQVCRAAGGAGVLAQAPTAKVVGSVVALGVAIIARRPDLAKVTGALALSAHLQAPLRRVLATRHRGPGRLSRRLLVTFGVLVLSDAAKLSGYVVGAAERLRPDESRLRRSGDVAW